MFELEHALCEYARDPEDAEKNLILAHFYHARNQSAGAISFYLRAAERTTDKHLSYYCLLKIAECFTYQGKRDNTVRCLYKHAISLLPERPEAYFLLSRHFERINEYTDAYTYAELGLRCADITHSPLRGQVDYPGKYGLLFEKAVASWWWGKVDECKRLFLDIKYNYSLDAIHLNAVNKNIETLEIDESEYKNQIIHVKSDNKITVVVQGAYKHYTDEVIRSYLIMPFVQKVVVSCWEDDKEESILSNRIEFVRNKKPSSYGTDNRNLQIVSSYEGLKRSETKTSVKVRSDQVYSKESLQIMYDYYNKHKGSNKIFVSGVFPSLLFHPNDHIFWGETSDLLTLFDIPLEQNSIVDRIRVNKNDLYKYYSYFTRSETYIGAHYCAKFNEEINVMLLQPEKYLYDNSENWHKTHGISNNITTQYFKSFPRKNMNMYWASKQINYPYEEQIKRYNQQWCEDGY